MEALEREFAGGLDIATGIHGRAVYEEVNAEKATEANGKLAAKNMARVPWEEVADRVRELHPKKDQEELRRRYDAMRELEIVRARDERNESVGGYLMRHSIPLVSSLYNFAQDKEYGVEWH